ncbi:MAG: cytochrome c [Candidatus Competibacter sp.]|nr:cytochrome c [Candidatus Competibacter sp.]
MNRIRSSVAALVVLAAASVAVGQSLGTPSPDSGAGKKRAAVCFACHGTGGIAKMPGTPHLAGQDRAYLEKALRAYREGTRQDPTMTAMAKPLSDADIANLALFFSLLPRTSNDQTAARTLETR